MHLAKRLVAIVLSAAMLSASILLLTACSTDSTPLVPLITSTPGPSNPNALVLKTYNSTSNGWSVSYPASWAVQVTTGTVQFASEIDSLGVGITSVDLKQKLDPDTLATQFNQSMQASIGESYLVVGTARQGNATEIAFSAQTTTNLQGYAFVEQRGTVLYSIIFSYPKDTVYPYQQVFSQILSSFQIPTESGGGRSGIGTTNLTPTP